MTPFGPISRPAANPGSGAPRNRAGIRDLRRRAITLTELILYLAVTFSVIIFSYRVLQEEDARQVETMAAADLRRVIDATQLYVANEYRTLRQDIVYRAQKAGGNKSLFASYALDQVSDPVTGFKSPVDLGYLPAYYGNRNAMQGNLDRNYRLMVRGVSCLDTANPQATLTDGAVAVPIPAGGTVQGQILPQFADMICGWVDDNGDGVVDPGEMKDELDLEVFLVTVPDANAAAVPPNVGNRITARAGTAAAGYIGLDNGNAQVVGPMGGWTYDPSKFDTAAKDHAETFPVAGNFASIIALSGYGVISDGEGPRDKAGQDKLSLCAGRTGAEYLECVTGDALWEDLAFAAIDRDGDGAVDLFPEIRGVGGIRMAPPTDGPDGIVSDGSISRIEGLVFLDMGPAFYLTNTPVPAELVVAQITNVGRIVMGEPVNTDGVPGFDLFSEVRNVHALSCAAGGTTTTDGVLAIDCDETYVPFGFSMTTDGVLDVAAESRFTRRLDIVTDAPSLLVPATDNPGRFLRLSDTAVILRNDTGDETRFDAQGLEAESLAAGTLATETLKLSGATSDEDVTLNPMVRLVTATVGSAGSPVTLADPDCPAGWDTVVEVVGVQPPDTYTDLGAGPPGGIIYDRVLSISLLNGSGSLSPGATVTYGRPVILPTTLQSPTCSQAGTTPVVFPIPSRPPFSIYGTRITENCEYGTGLDLEFDTHDVTNPLNTRISAIVGCAPEP
jgi:hypothetical protein